MTDRPPHPDTPESNDPAGHLSTETIADLQEGLIDDEPARRARRHLQDCPVCAAGDRALSDVRLRLAAAGDAGPMPADVIERVVAALAAEPAVGPGAATVTGLAGRASRPRPSWSMRVLQAAAVLVLLLAGAGIAVSAWNGGGSDTTTSADSAGGTAAQGAPEVAGAYPVTASGRDWDEESVLAAVPDLVSGAYTPPTAASPGYGPGSDAGSDERARELASAPAGRLADGPALAECVGRLNLGPVTPLSVDLAQWQGSPAGVIVLPTPDDPATVDVFVVEPSCPEGTFLFFTRAPRP